MALLSHLDLGAACSDWWSWRFPPVSFYGDFIRLPDFSCQCAGFEATSSGEIVDFELTQFMGQSSSKTGGPATEDIPVCCAETVELHALQPPNRWSGAEEPR